jgi:hypothetical protein
VFKALRQRLLCALGKHELVYCEDIPIVGVHCYRCLYCGFLKSVADYERRAQAFKSIVLAILAAAIFAVLLLLASQLLAYSSRRDGN